MDFRIELDLTRHCIETEIKRRHNRAVSDYFTGKEDRDALERRIECLQTALTTWDFQFLRRRYPALAGTGDATVVIARDDAGGPLLMIDGAVVVVEDDGTA